MGEVNPVFDLSPPHWDRGPLSVALELRQLLGSMIDQGSAIDSGGGDGCADLWIWVGGREFLLQISPVKTRPAPEETKP